MCLKYHVLQLCFYFKFNTAVRFWLGISTARVNMILSDTSSTVEVQESLSALDTPTLDPTSAFNVRKPRGFGRARVLVTDDGPGRSIPAEKTARQSAMENHGCAANAAFYVCINGWKGCCPTDPCIAGRGCLDSKPSYTSNGPPFNTGHSASLPSSSHLVPPPKLLSVPTLKAAVLDARADTTTAAGSTMVSGIESTSSPSSTGPILVASPAPSCPAANSTDYTDGLGIRYKIHCAMDNIYASDPSKIQVGVGEYSECFSSCSTSSTCAGFTYSGSDSDAGTDNGTCYLKAKMPRASFIARADGNYIACAKSNSSAYAAVPKASTLVVSGKHPPVGAIVGGVLGGIAAIALLSLLAFFRLRIRKQRIEDRNSGLKVNTGGTLNQQPISAPMGIQSIYPGHGHHRAGSTSNDVYSPYGGSYQPPYHTRQRSAYRGDGQWV